MWLDVMACGDTRAWQCGGVKTQRGCTAAAGGAGAVGTFTTDFKSHTSMNREDTSRIELYLSCKYCLLVPVDDTRNQCRG